MQARLHVEKEIPRLWKLSSVKYTHPAFFLIVGCIILLQACVVGRLAPAIVRTFYTRTFLSRQTLNSITTLLMLVVFPIYLSHFFVWTIFAAEEPQMLFLIEEMSFGEYLANLSWNANWVGLATAYGFWLVLLSFVFSSIWAVFVSVFWLVKRLRDYGDRAPN